MVAVAIAIAGLGAPEVVRARLTRMWALEGHVVAVLAVAFVVLTALVFAIPETRLDHPTRWYLPITFAAALVYACIPMLVERRRDACAAALLMFAGVWLGVVYATHLPAEIYVVALGALAVAYAAMGWAVEDQRIAKRLP